MYKYVKISVAIFVVIMILNALFWCFMIMFYNHTPMNEIPTLYKMKDIGICLILLSIANGGICATLVWLCDDCDF